MKVKRRSGRQGLPGEAGVVIGAIDEELTVRQIL